MQFIHKVSMFAPDDGMDIKWAHQETLYKYAGIGLHRHLQHLSKKRKPNFIGTLLAVVLINLT